MPTTAKMVAAFVFAILGFTMSEFYKPLLPEGSNSGQMSLICAAIGLLCGWIIAGPRAGKSYTKAWGLGIRTAVTTVFWALLGFAIYEMVLNSTKGSYAGSPMTAVMAVFDILLSRGAKMIDQNFLITMLGGGVVCGLITEFAARRWR